MRRLTALIALTLWASASRAEVLPQPGPGDPHVQSLDYDPEQVVGLRVALGYQLTIEFSSDERIEAAALGNSAVWQANANRRADHLFIKPMQGATPTNLTVITDVRRYNFNLTPAQALEPDLPYTVRFRYPVAKLERPSASPAAAASGVYRLSGDRRLRPERIFDDGRFTFIAWAASAALPAIFAVDDHGAEVLVNGAVRGDYYVVETVAQKMVFRSGERVASALRHAPKAARR